MKSKQRNRGKTQHTDNEFIMAIKIRSVNPWLPAAEIAEEVGEEDRPTRERLLKLEADGKVESKIHGNTKYFRLK
jgi:hypothetical protein